MRGSRSLGREADELMTIHEERHERRMRQLPTPRNIAGALENPLGRPCSVEACFREAAEFRNQP
jgi:hypothetical protein